MVFPEILDAVVPRLHICAAVNLCIKLLERNLARFVDHVVDRQFDKPQVFWRKVISIVGSMKNLNGCFAVRHF